MQPIVTASGLLWSPGDGVLQCGVFRQEKGANTGGGFWKQDSYDDFVECLPMPPGRWHTARSMTGPPGAELRGPGESGCVYQAVRE